jgi:cytochrome c-type biogenesis protein CcmH/NrfF
MDRLLTLQMWLWWLLPVLALLVIWALLKAMRHSERGRGADPSHMRHLIRLAAHAQSNERTLTRWSRIVKTSNTAFWAYVSQKQDPKQ